MIVIDMDMPKSCGSCRMSGTDVCNEWTNLKGYDMGQKIADSCPIKCDIDDIKAEIREETDCPYGDKCLGANCPSNTDCMIMGEHVIWIINKHISGKEQP